MHGWTIPAPSFNAATLTGLPLQNGSVISLEEVMSEHACQVAAVGAAMGDQAVITLEGSLDGTNWYSLANGGPPPAPSAGATGVALLTATAPALYVRTAGYTSGSSVVTTLITSH